MHKRRKMIIVGLVYGVIVTLLFVYTYNMLVERSSSDIIKHIRDIDNEQRYDRPYSDIEAISSSNITTVEDLFELKYFDNDNITVFFPDGETYFYRIGYDTGMNVIGNLHVFRSDGSQIRTVERDHRRFEDGGRQSGFIWGRIAENGNLTLRFTGNACILFLSPQSIDFIDEMEENSISINGGHNAFNVPRILIGDLPSDRRIEARTTSERGSYYKVRYYDEELHPLGETEGTGTIESDIPSGYSNSIYVVVESEGNVTIQFSPSEPIMGELAPLGWFLVFCYMMVMGFGLTLILLKAHSLGADERIKNQRSQH